MEFVRQGTANSVDDESAADLPKGKAAAHGHQRRYEMETSHIAADTTGPTTGPTTADPLQVYTRKASGLVREVRLVDLVAYNLGAVAPLTGAVTIMFFTVAAFPRANIYLAILFSAILTIPVLIVFSLMSATFPKLGGDYLYNSRILHPAIGLATNLLFVVTQVLTIGFSATAVALLGMNPMLAAIGDVTNSSTISSWAQDFTISNRNAVFITAVVTVIILCVLAAIRSALLFRVMTILVGIFAVAVAIDLVIMLATGAESFSKTYNDIAGQGAYEKVVHAGKGSGLYPSEDGYSLKYTIGSMFFWVGCFMFIMYGAYISGEVRRAGQRKRMLGAMLGSLVIQTIVLLLSIAAFYHATGENFAISAVAGNQESGIASFPYYAALVANNKVVASILALAFILWVFPTVNAFMAIVQRGLYVYSFERLLPGWISRVNPRTHTPVVAVVLMGGLSIIAVAFAAYNANYGVALTLAIFPSTLR